MGRELSAYRDRVVADLQRDYPPLREFIRARPDLAAPVLDSNLDIQVATVDPLPYHDGHAAKLQFTAAISVFYKATASTHASDDDALDLLVTLSAWATERISADGERTEEPELAFLPGVIPGQSYGYVSWQDRIIITRAIAYDPQEIIGPPEPTLGTEGEPFDTIEVVPNVHRA